MMMSKATKNLPGRNGGGGHADGGGVVKTSHNLRIAMKQVTKTIGPVVPKVTNQLVIMTTVLPTRVIRQRSVVAVAVVAGIGQKM